VGRRLVKPEGLPALQRERPLSTPHTLAAEGRISSRRDSALSEHRSTCRSQFQNTQESAARGEHTYAAGAPKHPAADEVPLRLAGWSFLASVNHVGLLCQEDTHVVLRV